jgi:hypothetical protein
MAVAAPNQTHLKILGSVLRLESFTVAELCLHAGLERSMVYRELAELQKRGFLTSDSSVGEGESRPPHCPPKRYELSADLQKRKALESELGSFFPESEQDPQSNPHLRQAQEALNLLSVEVLETSLETIEGSRLDHWETGLARRFEEAQTELRRAMWESETDFSEADVSGHPIMLANRLYESLHGRFTKQVRQERARRVSETARREWGSILTSALRATVPVASAAAAAAALYTFNFDTEIAKTWAALSENIKEHMGSIAKARLSVHGDMLSPFVSSLELDMKMAATEPDFLAILAKQGIKYANSAEEPLALVRELKSKTEDYRLLFDQANLAQLADRHDEAYYCWREYLSKKPVPDKESSEQPIVGRIPAERWSSDAYRQAVQRLRVECKASVAALSETPFDENEGYAVELKLYNPVRDKTEQQTTFISIGDTLVQAKRLYMITTEAEQPTVLGLPSFACAAWFRSRVGERRAWDLADTVKPTERIVKVEFFRDATADSRVAAERVLTDSLSAELVR